MPGFHGRRVDGKVALVTGAAMGLGQAMAETLAREGAKVVIADLQSQRGETVVDAIRREGGEALFLRHDVSRIEAWDENIASVLEQFGRLDVLVNNAGVSLTKNVEDTTLEQWRSLMSINLDGVFLGVQAAIRAMKKTGGGSIINISSIDGIVGESQLAAYCASKGGVRLLTKSAALHCAEAKYNIRVNSVHPGYIRTPLLDAYFRDTENSAAEELRTRALHPIGRFGEPQDIADAVLFLASEESRFMTGAELVVDGGYTAQ